MVGQAFLPASTRSVDRNHADRGCAARQAGMPAHPIILDIVVV